MPPAPDGDSNQVEEVLVKLADARLITTGEGMPKWPMKP